MFKQTFDIPRHQGLQMSEPQMVCPKCYSKIAFFIQTEDQPTNMEIIINCNCPEPEPPAEEEYQCEECKKWFPTEEWGEDDYSVYCELCGEHSAYKCPNCEELNDHVYIKSRKATPCKKFKGGINTSDKSMGQVVDEAFEE